MADHTPRLLDALDVFEDGIYIINDDYTVEYMNKFMKELFGDGVGMKCHDVLIGSDKPCDWCKYDEIFEWTSLIVEMYFGASLAKGR